MRNAKLSDTALSKTIAHALRHNPKLYGLELDAQGWARIDSLVTGLRSRGHANVTEADIERIVGNQKDKIRYEFDASRRMIRATHGHSTTAVPHIQYSPIVPPTLLYHGTSPAAVDAIFESGHLRPMRRQYVHLASDMEHAQQVGRRKARDPMILQISALRAFEEANIHFYRPVNGTIWLADAIPSKYIEVAKCAKRN